jgi:hypothetical protein
MESVKPRRPHCKATTRAGKPCRSFAVRDGLCAGHAGLGLAADPQWHAQRKHELAAARAKERHDEAERLRLYAEAGVRGSVALRLGERISDVVRVLVDVPIAREDARTLATAVNQAFGMPVERVETHDEGALDLDNLSNAQLVALKRALLGDETLGRIVERDKDVTEAA